MTKKMKNPLNRRLPRELKSEFGKYLVIFLFFIMVISLVSGFLVADTSLHTAYLDAFDKYNIEDGNFAYAEEASDDAIAAIEKDGKVKVYANFYKEEDTDDFESTFRAFGERNDIDKVCLLDGDMPKADTDVAIDRLYAKNHDLEIGDKFGVAGKDLTISGIVALSDYSTLYQNASDMMFDNDKFGVGVMTDAGFATLRENHLHYNYSWSYDTAPEDDAEAKDMAEDLMPILAENGMLTNFLPEYLNQAIIFAGDDMGGDMSMILAFLYIVIVILAFRVFHYHFQQHHQGSECHWHASCFRLFPRRMVRHYLIMPMLVLLVAAVVGNVLGYTWLEQIFANQYLASYGLTTYEVLLNPQAFVLTTVIPLILLFIINFVMLTVKMRISPLQFIRRDLSKRKKKKAFRLNTKIPIMRRFQMRVIFQNFPNHVMIFFGVFFANFILMFGMILQPMLAHYQNTITDNVLSAYQYILKTPAETETDGAEKFCFGSLDTLPEKRSSESVSLYGVKPDSDYVKLHSSGKKVDISTAYAEKYGVEKGDTITLKDPYGSDKYKFEVPFSIKDGYVLSASAGCSISYSKASIRPNGVRKYIATLECEASPASVTYIQLYGGYSIDGELKNESGIGGVPEGTNVTLTPTDLDICRENDLTDILNLLKGKHFAGWKSWDGTGYYVVDLTENADGSVSFTMPTEAEQTGSSICIAEIWEDHSGGTAHLHPSGDLQGLR